MSKIQTSLLRAALCAACCGFLLACRSPADPTGVDVLGDAGTPSRQKPEVDPSGDKPVGPIAAEQLPSGGAGSRAPDGSQLPIGGSGGVGGGGGTTGKVPVVAHRIDPTVTFN